MATAITPRARWQATFACLGMFVVGWRTGGAAGIVIAAAGFGLVGLAWLLPTAYAPIQRAVDRIIQAVLTCLTWTLLAMVYFGVFTFLRAWGRLTRRPALALRPDPTLTTYLLPSRDPDPDHFRHQF